MRKSVAIVCVAALCAVLFRVAFAADGGEPSQFSKLVGNVIVVGSEDDLLKTTEDEPEEINAGGLVIVQIHDLGSAPVEIVEVANDARFETVGEVRGVGVKAGRRLMGGGYMWLMFRAGDQLGAAKITVKYKSAPHAGGEEKEEVHYLEIVANE